VVTRKWGDRPHWEHDAVRLGEDEHGTWLGAPAGTMVSRPGVTYPSRYPSVRLVPRDEWFLATFYADEPRPLPNGWVEVYVDIATVAHWSEGAVTAVDLDLDVIRGRTGRVWVDDEDEFADHQVRLGYPDEVVRAAVESCAAVHAAVVARRAPYDGKVGDSWLRRLAEVTAGRESTG
jgi:protein associated with RNAse G/E